MDEAELRHEAVLDELVMRLEGYGHKVARHVNYGDSGVTVGEIDALVCTNHVNGTVKRPRIYEVKGSPKCSFAHAVDQLKRAQKFFKREYNVDVALVYVTSYHGWLYAQRVR